jgi:phosphatidylinositol glycan class M
VYAGDLPFCMFVQTFAFVAFNKVSTAQYFVWYFALLPVTMPALSDTTYMLVSVFAVWGLTQVHWLVRTGHIP